MTKIQIETLPDCIQTRPPIAEASPEWQTMHDAGLNGVTGIVCRDDRTILSYSSREAAQLQADSSKLARAFQAAGIIVYLNQEPPKEAEVQPTINNRRRWGKLGLRFS